MTRWPLALFAALLAGCQARTPPSAAAPTPQRPPPHPYTVAGLGARAFARAEVAVERDLGDRGGYRACVVSYPSDGLRLFALMNVPARPRPPRGFPVVVLSHGYIPPRSWSTVSSYRLVDAAFAREGFLVLKPDYRGHGDSPGLAEGPFRSMLYAVDVLSLIAAIPSIAEADPRNIFAYGHSMGGDVTLRVLEATDKVKAATLWAPVSAPFPESVLYYARKRGETEEKEERKQISQLFAAADYASLSALDNVGLIRAPLLLHHGTADEDVPYAWSVMLAERLKAAGAAFTFLSYEGENHNLSRRSFAAVLARDASFFREHMAP